MNMDEEGGREWKRKREELEVRVKVDEKRNG